MGYELSLSSFNQLKNISGTLLLDSDSASLLKFESLWKLDRQQTIFRWRDGEEKKGFLVPH